MKTRLNTAILLALLLCGCGGERGLTESEHREEAEKTARSAAQKLVGTLLGEVQRAMKDGGPANAVRTCAEKAQPLTAEVAAEFGVTMRRVTEKTRNPLDTPDDYERRILARFADMHDGGKLSPETTHIEVTEAEGTKALRFMKPITMKKPCLACHAAPDQLSPEVRSALADRYPDDQATGYREGDLRGAISVIVPLSE